MYYHNSFLLFACSLALARFRDFFFFHLFSFDAAGMVTSQLGHHYPFVRALECLAHSHIPTHEGYLTDYTIYTFKPIYAHVSCSETAR